MSVFTDFLADVFAQRLYLVEITGYDLTAGTAKTVYFADHDYVTKPSDANPNRIYEGRLANSFTFRRELFGDSRIGGRSIPGYGAIQINNADGVYDHLQGWSFYGRRCFIRMGDPRRMAYADFGTIFDGTIDTADFDDDFVTFKLRSLDFLLDKPLTTSKFAGTGGLEGGDDLKNKTKPACFGIVHDIAPVYLGVVSGFPTWQVHDSALGPIDDVPQVCDNALPLTKVAGTPSAGQYQVSPSTGTFRTATIPVGTVTCDVRGYKPGGTLLLTMADIAKAIAVDIGGVGAADAASIAALNALNDASVGYYTGASETTCAVILDAIMNAGGGHWGYSRVGEFNVGRVDAPAAVSDASFTRADILQITRQAAPPPAWRVTLGHTRAWTVLEGNNVAGAVSDARREFVGEEWRTVKWPATEAEELAIKAAHLNAQDLRFDALIEGAADAQTEVDRLGGIYGVPREIFQILVKTRPFALDLASTIEITDKRFNLGNPKRFRLIGMDEDSSLNQVLMTLWG